MNNSIARHVSKRPVNQAGITKPEIIKSVSRNPLPAIFIERTIKNIYIQNAILNVDNKSLPLIGLPLIEAVRFLKNNDVNASVTVNQFLFAPSELLLDFNNVLYDVHNIYCSPFKTNTIFPSCLKNFNHQDPSSFSLDIESVYSEANDVFFTKQNSLEEISYNNGASFFFKDNNLFLGSVLDKTQCTVKYFINTFCFHLSLENVVDINAYSKKVFQNKLDDKHLSYFIELFDSPNRDKL